MEIFTTFNLIVILLSWEDFFLISHKRLGFLSNAAQKGSNISVYVFIHTNVI